MPSSQSPLLPPLYGSTPDDFAAAEDAGSLRLGLASGDLRWAAVDLSAPLEKLRRRLDTSPVATLAVGRAMAAATLLLRFSTKYPGRLRFEVLGDGPLGKVTVDVDSEGHLRAIVDQLRFPGVEGAPLDVGRAVGKGLLRVTQSSSKRPTPWSSQTHLVDGEIGSDLVHYLDQSQQVRSAALLGVELSTEGVVAAGGLLVEALPGAQEDHVVRLEANIRALDGVGSTLAESGVGGLIRAVLDGFEIEEMERHPIVYGCRCQRDELLARLRTLPSQDLEEVSGEDGKAIVECAFCLGQFMFSTDELLTPS